MSKSNAAKSVEKINPVVGMILALRGTMSKKTGPAKVLHVDHDKGNINVYRPGGRSRYTTIDFGSLSRYRPTTESEFPGVDFDETGGAARSTLTDAPTKANDEEPKREPPPAPPPAANDSALLVAIEKINESNRIERERMELRIDSKFSAFVREQQAATNAFMERVLDRFASPVAQAAPVKTKEEEREEATLKQVKDEMPWAEPQLWRFIDETMEFVTFSTQAERDRALRPGEVFDQFSLWCEVNNLRVPFQRTVFTALLQDDRTKARWKVSSKEEKTPLAIRRQTRFGFDETGPIGKDVQDIVAHARKTAWPSLPETHRETIARLLLDKVSKTEIIKALNHIAAMPRRGEGSYTPDKVLVAKHIRALVKIASAEGPAK